MQTKLTLRLDDRLIAQAKAWARSRDVSLSQVVGQFFAQLPARDGWEASLSPWARRTLGAGRGTGEPMSDAEERAAYRDYLEAKYR